MITPHILHQCKSSSSSTSAQMILLGTRQWCNWSTSLEVTFCSHWYSPIDVTDAAPLHPSPCPHLFSSISLNVCLEFRLSEWNMIRWICLPLVDLTPDLLAQCQLFYSFFFAQVLWVFLLMLQMLPHVMCNIFFPPNTHHPHPPCSSCRVIDDWMPNKNWSARCTSHGPGRGPNVSRKCL